MSAPRRCWKTWARARPGHRPRQLECGTPASGRTTIPPRIPLSGYVATPARNSSTSSCAARRTTGQCRSPSWSPRVLSLPRVHQQGARTGYRGLSPTDPTAPTRSRRSVPPAETGGRRDGRAAGNQGAPCHRSDPGDLQRRCGAATPTADGEPRPRHGSAGDRPAGLRTTDSRLQRGRSGSARSTDIPRSGPVTAGRGDAVLDPVLARGLGRTKRNIL
jgi:hypothetical protein